MKVRLLNGFLLSLIKVFQTFSKLFRYFASSCDIRGGVQKTANANAAIIRHVSPLIINSKPEIIVSEITAWITLMHVSSKSIVHDKWYHIY